MKLTEIIPTNQSIITEGHVDPSVLMNIDNVIRDGKVTNNMQNIYMAKMIEMLKYGNFQRVHNWNEIETPARIMAFVKGLPATEAVAMAKKFKELLYVKDLDLLNKFYDPQLELAMWQKLVLQHQD